MRVPQTEPNPKRSGFHLAGPSSGQGRQQTRGAGRQFPLEGAHWATQGDRLQPPKHCEPREQSARTAGRGRDAGCPRPASRARRDSSGRAESARVAERSLAPRPPRPACSARRPPERAGLKCPPARRPRPPCSPCRGAVPEGRAPVPGGEVRTLGRHPRVPESPAGPRSAFPQGVGTRPRHGANQTKELFQTFLSGHSRVS